MKKVVYLHGLNSSSKIFNHIISQLPPHEAITIDYDTFEPIEKSYSFILSRLSINESYYLVGHSLGGLISYLISSRFNGITVDGLVTISSPFGGSDHARLLKWMYPSYRVLTDLSPKSDVIKEVNQAPTSRIKMLSLISANGNLPIIGEKNDGVVTLDSQKLSPAKKKISVSANHFEIVQDKVTVLELKKFIFPDYK